jgi:cell filamentation protein
MSYVLEDGICLKNKLGATDDRVLDTLAADYTTIRIGMVELGFGPQPTGSPPSFDLALLKALHQFIFQDVFEWAGRTRDEHIALTDGTTAYVAEIRKLDKFTDSVDIPAALAALFADIRASNGLTGLSRVDFCRQAAGVLVRLNIIHPFREGNGRTQRAFVAALARHAGYEIGFDVMSKRQNLDASIDSTVTAFGPMQALLEQLTDPRYVVTLRAAYQAVATQYPALADQEIRIVAPGQSYLLRMLLLTPMNFVASTPNARLIAGPRGALPSPEPQAEDTFEI